MCIRDRLLLVAAMAVGMLAGCGGGKSSISQDGSSDAAEGNEKAEMADAKDVDGTTITFWHSMGGVNGPVSYTHLDVYKRQALSAKGEVSRSL